MWSLAYETVVSLHTAKPPTTSTTRSCQFAIHYLFSYEPRRTHLYYHYRHLPSNRPLEMLLAVSVKLHIFPPLSTTADLCQRPVTVPLFHKISSLPSQFSAAIISSATSLASVVKCAHTNTNIPVFGGVPGVRLRPNCNPNHLNNC